ncbi:RNA recognition motif-containing protein, putative [Eimeria tenella]|uniref:RNA recognition motif-containing protein, putative n=1 Tax=Eimeria tenella TaxID=5802 RepID=U6KWW9_EIMTE|nr:RNA recognition motif-containing protein, putative [Eimeria tenella]CDJ39990.1 RNA recognition motif-containing protein, putative [Eimeria tenella]|eukprot:XP_013230743.1 RNA recognition motif-containing protein, putative [Eimeria tenella]
MLGMLPHAKGNAAGGASCFYITLRPQLFELDEKYSLFGEVLEGVETLERINAAFVDSKHIPLTPVRILRAYVLADPFFCRVSRFALGDAAAAPAAAAEAEAAEAEAAAAEEMEECDKDKLGFTPPASPEPLAAEALSDEELDEIMAIEKVDQKEAEARKVTLEILGDIPDADMAPPENVLFVAKLNPATQDDDLRLLFSRSGNSACSAASGAAASPRKLPTSLLLQHYKFAAAPLQVCCCSTL